MTGLTWRDRRWTWAWLALRWTATAVLIVPIIVLYLPAKGVVAAFDALGDWFDGIHVRWHNRDIARKYGYARKPGAARPEGWLP